MTLTVFRILVRNFVDCSSFGICMFCYDYTRIMLYLEGDHRGKILFSSHHIRGISYQQDLPLWIFTWLRLFLDNTYFYSLHLFPMNIFYSLYILFILIACVCSLHLCDLNLLSWPIKALSHNSCLLFWNSEGLGHYCTQIYCTWGTSNCKFINEQFHRLNSRLVFL